MTLNRTRHQRKPNDRHSERGQVIVVVLLALGLFLVGMVAIAVDFTNLWFRRQAAQAAADSACIAGVMDMFTLANGGVVDSYDANYTTALTAGTGFSCSTTFTPDRPPCRYARLNGFPASGLGSGSRTELDITFPGSLSGVSTDTPPPAIAPYPYIRAVTTEDVRVFFAGLFSGSTTQRVRTSATCALRWEVTYPPILVLAPTGGQTFRVNGTAHAVTIWGGPTRGIQVNSNAVDSDPQPAASLPSGCSSIMLDLSDGGPLLSGSDVGVFGGPLATPCSYDPGTTGRWLSPASPIADPLQLAVAPAQPSAGSIVDKAAGVDGCPATAVGGCKLYLPGAYTSGISITNENALFAPGVYWVERGFEIKSNSCVRPLDTSVFSAGDGSGGTTFYLADNRSVNVIANAGDCVGRGMGNFALDSAKCHIDSLVPGGPTPTSFTGSVLLGPCTGTYGDLLGTANPKGMQHGVLFFQNRAQTPSGGNAPDWHGGGNFLLAGTLYFHQCKTSGGADAGGTGCSGSAYNTEFTFQSDGDLIGVLIGNIVADELAVGGHLILNVVPGAGSYGLKASMVR